MLRARFCPITARPINPMSAAAIAALPSLNAVSRLDRRRVFVSALAQREGQRPPAGSRRGYATPRMPRGLAAVSRSARRPMARLNEDVAVAAAPWVAFPPALGSDTPPARAGVGSSRAAPQNETSPPSLDDDRDGTPPRSPGLLCFGPRQADRVRHAAARSGHHFPDLRGLFLRAGHAARRAAGGTQPPGSGVARGHAGLRRAAA